MIETSVVTGKVAFIPEAKTFFSAPADTLLLTPNYKAVFQTANGDLRKEKTDSRLDKAWTEGKLVFRNMPFGEIGKILERTYGKSVVFADENLKNCRLTGTFQNNSLQEVMFFLSKTKDYTYTIHGDQLLISGAACNAAPGK